MKILVTGANGYLGSGIVKKLLDNGIDVIATDFGDEHIDKRAEIIKADIFAQENPYDYFGKPDVLLHLAWRDGFVHNSDKHMEDLPLHYFFIKRMAEGGVKRIAVMGTMHEIGFWEGSIDENTPCNPSTLYGISKNALRNTAELLCKANNVEFQWLRAYYIVANTIYGNSIFSKIALAESEGKELFPFTTGQNQYDFLDYDEFCMQVAEAVGQDTVTGIINICSGKPEKLADRVERFIKENNFKIKLEYGKFPDRPYDSKAVWGKSDKIDSIISFNK